MSEVMFILYFIELLSTIDKVAYGFIFSLVVLGAISQLATMVTQDIPANGMQDTFNKFVKSNIKRYILVLSILLSTVILIPSERTMYIMAGLKTGDKALDTVSQPETFQKAEQLLNRKLDEMLGDQNETQTQTETAD